MRLIKSTYSPPGTATVILEYKGKQYTGKAFFSRDEKCPPSAFFGQRIAEKRALIEYWKEKRDINRIKQQALKSFKKDLDAYVYDGVLEEGLYETILEKLDQHIEYYGKEVKDAKKVIQTEKESIKENIKIRQHLFENKGQ